MKSVVVAMGATTSITMPALGMAVLARVRGALVALRATVLRRGIAEQRRRAQKQRQKN
jgi:hypothetical protein